MNNNKDNYWPRIIVKQQSDGRLEYTYVKTSKKAFQAAGTIVASYDTNFFLQNEHTIQRNLKERYAR